MNYIDLTLKKKTTQGGVQQIKKCFLANIIDSTNNILIILGSAGSGKTSILKKFLDENIDVAQFFTVKKFLKLDKKISDSAKILLLDGLDEYRSVEHDKTFVTEALSNKLNEINQDIKVVISCREMDWYGNDTKSLKNTLGKNVDLYQILPLNYGQKIALSKLFKVVNPENFIEKCGQYGFLENPQMLKMLVKTCNVSSKVITTKSGLYKKFINHSLESNEEYTRNESNLIDESDIYKYAGYIAFYAIFCNVDKFDEAFIDEIVDSQKGYSRGKIQKTLFTKLFNEKNFDHRTIAEFLLAQFIFNEKFSTDIMKHRIKSLFLSNGQVPTELKGTFSWLCSLSSDLEIIKIDPYYQYCHGDNSMFDDRLKENIILEIKTLSNDNPYFMNGGKSQDFYNSNLDDFLIQELNKNLKSKNHYFLFLLQVIDTEKISNIMQSFLKELTENSSISSYVFSKIVKWLDDKKFLKNTLDKIKDGEIPDEENRIKESILKALYPKDMTHEEVTPYLLCYQQENYIGNYSFLYKTDYKNKKILLEKLHKEGKLNESLRYFFYDYFAETMSKFENELTAKDIYKIILDFRVFYYDKYRRLRIEYLSKRLNLNEKKITKLANKLFALYIQDVLKIGGDFYNFRYFFPYPPNNQTNILLNIMSDQLSKDDNKKLFNLALSFLPKDDQNTIIPTQEIKKKSKLMCLEGTLNLWLNPEIHEIQLWETEQKAKIQQKIKIDKKTAMRNEIYFKNQTDIDIQKNLNILFNVSRFLIYGHYNYLNDLTDNTVDRLKNILKNAVFKPLINPDLLTIDSLAKDNTDANRDIDRMYYASCVLNEPKKMEKITNSDFLKYLYINSLVRDTKSNYCKYKEKNRTEIVISTLKEYVELVSKTYFSIMKSYIEPENSMEKLKKLIRDIYNENIQKSVLNNFLSIYNFSISLDDLRKLQAHAHGGNEDEIIALIVLLDEQEDDFTLKRAISLYRLLGTEQRNINLSDIKSNVKIRFINYLMNVFDTEKSINPISGMQSDKDSCTYFLREALNQLDLKELRQLLDNRKNKENCIWINRINHQITQIKQKNTDQQYSPYSISQLKNFILSDDITSSQDFFQDTVIKIKKLKDEIEGNRCNEKEVFFNEDNNGKQEDACRDIIMQRLKDKYGDDIQLTKEQHEANNRVDINISTVKRPKYEVQIECKKDSNRGIYRGIPDQLIKKYLSRQAEHGIYLIFNFSKIKKSLLINKVRQSIPEDYKNNIEIIIIDLKKSP